VCEWSSYCLINNTCLIVSATCILFLSFQSRFVIKKNHTHKKEERNLIFLFSSLLLWWWLLLVVCTRLVDTIVIKTKWFNCCPIVSYMFLFLYLSFFFWSLFNYNDLIHCIFVRLFKLIMLVRGNIMYLIMSIETFETKKV
jgi:hypothetical protein